MDYKGAPYTVHILFLWQAINNLFMDFMDNSINKEAWTLVVKNFFLVYLI